MPMPLWWIAGKKNKSSLETEKNYPYIDYAARKAAIADAYKTAEGMHELQNEEIISDVPPVTP
jgi:hypothetical protein